MANNNDVFSSQHFVSRQMTNAISNQLESVNNFASFERNVLPIDKQLQLAEDRGDNQNDITSFRINENQIRQSKDILGFSEISTHEVKAYNITLKQGDVVDIIIMPRSTFFDDATVVTAQVLRVN